MKKIGLLNFHYSNHNYGAVLQAYALQIKIKNIAPDFKVENINFIPTDSITLRARISLGKFLRLLKILRPIVVNEKIGNVQVFERFRQQWLEVGPPLHHKKKLLNLKYQMIIVGSDQVWRPEMTKPNVDVYFLNFADSSCRKIAYAASFGVDTWRYNQSLTNKIKKYLSNFKYISCRENSGVNICKTQFGIEANHVLDPTLLHNSDVYLNIINNSTSDMIYPPFISYYKLDLDTIFSKLINKIAESTKSEIKNIYYDKNQEYLEVADWLNSIHKSKIIVTDSFHCVCFSIIFKKPFIVYPNPQRGMTRLYSLLSSLGLEHLIYDEQKKSLDSYINESLNIDYESVHKTLEKLREKSANFIATAITNN
ncbi:polysaccharide pyruvyl transferase family protein [Providencia sp. PROV114]|uniref:polysaccharide pyruvyl transferase family protein n=1 Tax=Providencia sp. PROV114 TaxID=2949825 RepID=UPI0023499F38|nr:polysaccharide pyruvyl transferase family protein [Providencia sp. PROV114]WOB82038.1 polysaccharide pyruvyl transferase family protein [Providencia sp. PROV114]